MSETLRRSDGDIDRSMRGGWMVVALVACGCTGGAGEEPDAAMLPWISFDAARTSDTADALGAPDCARSDGWVSPEFDLGPLAARCPAEFPTYGSPCELPHSYECEYGNDPRVGCRPSASCVGTWSVWDPRCAPLTTAARTTKPTAGTACDVEGALYDRADGMCVCRCTDRFSKCGCSGEMEWDCLVGPWDQRCPRLPPRLGGACAEEGLECFYNCRSFFAREAVCSRGAWERWSPSEGDGPCE